MEQEITQRRLATTLILVVSLFSVTRALGIGSLARSHFQLECIRRQAGPDHDPKSHGSVLFCVGGLLFSFLILHWLIAVGTVIADRPPHRPVRAELPHTVLIADVDVQTSRLHVHPAIRATWLRTVSRPPSGSVSGPVATVQVGPRKDKRNPRDLCARALSYFLYGRPRDKREPSGLTTPHTCPRERIK